MFFKLSIFSMFRWGWSNQLILLSTISESKCSSNCGIIQPSRRGSLEDKPSDKMPVFLNLAIQQPSSSSLNHITPRLSTEPTSSTSDVSTTSNFSLSFSTHPTLKSAKQFNEDNPSLNADYTKNHTLIDKEESREVNTAVASPGKIILLMQSGQ